MENLRPDSNILDVAIIGGGPAGTAAAIEAGRHGLRAAIYERDRFPRDKVCGEFISAEALPSLQIVIPRELERGTAIHAAEFISAHGSARAFCLPQPALGLSRRSLDAALWKAAEVAGIETLEGESVRRVRKIEAGRIQASLWEIESAGGSFRRAKALIIACGRWWTVEGLASPARREASRKAGDSIGVKTHFAGVPPRGRVEMYFFRGGYCGLAPVEGGDYNVCCLARRERISECGGKRIGDFAAWLAQLARLPALEARLRGAVQVSSTVATAPVDLARRAASQSGALMVGDACGFLDPFTGEGISMALHSGGLAAQTVAKSLREGLGDEPAAEAYRRRLARAVGRSYRIAATARGLMQGPRWVQGLATLPLPWIGKRLLRETRWRDGWNLSS